VANVIRRRLLPIARTVPPRVDLRETTLSTSATADEAGHTSRPRLSSTSTPSNDRRAIAPMARQAAIALIRRSVNILVSPTGDGELFSTTAALFAFDQTTQSIETSQSSKLLLIVTLSYQALLLAARSLRTGTSITLLTQHSRLAITLATYSRLY
jgi:hypothetical protein